MRLAQTSEKAFDFSELADKGLWNCSRVVEKFMAAQWKTHFQAPFHLSMAVCDEILINTMWAQVRRATLGLNFKTSGLCFSSLFSLLASWNAGGPAIQLLSTQGKVLILVKQQHGRNQRCQMAT